jgi:hypothetical protein
MSRKNFLIALGLAAVGLLVWAFIKGFDPSEGSIAQYRNLFSPFLVLCIAIGGLYQLRRKKNSKKKP